MQFKEIIGNQETKRFLTGIIGRDTIPHALMFHGRPGSSKLALALATAQMIVCQHKKEGDSCGECNACKKAAKLIHPDIHFVFPVIKKEHKKREETTSSDFLGEWRYMIKEHPYFSFKDWTNHIKAENSPPNINTRECNEIIHKLGLQSFESPAKILIIWMPEYLGKEGNRLLKLIEEPTDDTFILVIAEDLGKILGTILSRTQKVHVQPFTDSQIMDYLETHIKIDGLDHKQLATLADGNLGLALQKSGEALVDYSDLLFDWIRTAYKAPPDKLINLINQLAGMGREQQKNFLEYGLHFFREYLFFLSTQKASQRLSAKEREIAGKMTKILDLPKCEKLVELLNNGIIHIARNVNPKISFMSDSMAIANIMRSEEVVIL